MTTSMTDKEVLRRLIEQELKPYVKKIDLEAYYAESFLRKLGESGLLFSAERTEKEVLSEEIDIITQIAKTCMTTAFCLWCHLAMVTYVRNTENHQLRDELLTPLEKGRLLGGTGLSNPLKYYAGLENLHLKAERTNGGYLISGGLPAVSNLGEDHFFAIIAVVNNDEQIMCVVSCEAKVLTLKVRNDYLGLNGSATYVCIFKEVFVPDEKILALNANSFLEKVRPVFIAYQIPLGLGVTAASIEAIEKVADRQNGCNQFLQTQPDGLSDTVTALENELKAIIQTDYLDWKEIARIRLSTAYLTLEAVQSAMLHHGGAAYVNASASARRLREAYFFVNLSPTVKHLEKLLSFSNTVKSRNKVE